jgi:hypothetical protein
MNFAGKGQPAIQTFDKETLKKLRDLRYKYDPLGVFIKLDLGVLR